MRNKILETMEIALSELAPTQDKVILISNTEVYNKKDTSINIIEVSEQFSPQDVLSLIGNVRYIGILNPDKTIQFTVSELMSLLPNKRSAAIVSIKNFPTSCEVIYSEPEIGSIHIEGNYEYRYGQSCDFLGDLQQWTTVPNQQGWCVKIRNNSEINYIRPLTMIQGYPVTNMANLFRDSQTPILNLIDWDTSNVTNARNMFIYSHAVTINGLNAFDTSNIVDMSHMFYQSKAANLDVSSFNTSNVTDMNGMFDQISAKTLDLINFDTSKVTSMKDMFQFDIIKNLDLRNFNTSNVTDMSGMFYHVKTDNLDVSNFDTSKVTDMNYTFGLCSISTIDVKSFNTANVTNMKRMFFGSDFKSLDLSSFDTTNVTDVTFMFSSSRIGTIVARNQLDLEKYTAEISFPDDIIISLPPTLDLD